MSALRAHRYVPVPARLSDKLCAAPTRSRWGGQH